MKEINSIQSLVDTLIVQPSKDKLFPIKSQAEIFKILLESVSKINFFAIKYPNAKIKADDIKGKKLNRSDYIVISIDETLALAKDNCWSLCKRNGNIYLYNGAFWQVVEKSKFLNFLGKVSEKLGVEKNTARYHAFKDELFRQFLSTAFLEIPENENLPTLINLLNGTFEISLENQVLRKFNESDFLTYQLPFSYNPDATAPLWLKFLNEVLPDKEKQNILAESLAYIFVNPNVLKLEKVLILYGSGANGKSVVFEVVSSLLGKENISNYSLQSLTNESGYQRAKIGDKLLNYASELNGRLETDIFKQLASGEPIECRLPYAEPFIQTRYAKLIFNCNALPKEVEHSNAFFRRFNIIHFDVTIPENKQDKELANKIIENELSGVFGWVLAGLERLLSQKGFSDCKAVNDARLIYENESDSVKSFLDEYSYSPNADNYTLVKIMYDQYKAYCFDDGFRAVNKTNFKKRLNHYKMYVKRMAVGYVCNATSD